MRGGHNPHYAAQAGEFKGILALSPIRQPENVDTLEARAIGLNQHV